MHPSSKKEFCIPNLVTFLFVSYIYIPLYCYIITQKNRKLSGGNRASNIFSTPYIHHILCFGSQLFRNIIIIHQTCVGTHCHRHHVGAEREGAGAE